LNYASGANGHTEFVQLATEADGTLNAAKANADNVFDYALSWPTVFGGAWHQLVASWDGVALRCYLDGVLSAITPATVLYRTGAITFGIGGAHLRAASSLTRVDAYMSAAAIWTSAISDAVIANQFSVLALEATGPIGQPATSGQVSTVITQLSFLELVVDEILAAVRRDF
jgi:hypothetical protein